ncbi:hypothetical protein ACH4E7_03035 [Kitasatospora sp. NPDC018058]|uniref:hypothetical protein n=1 Tax=Kitasatospora sp. NPDC018058 TaxID=3364025 RepID=UPI0037BFE99F
MSDEALRVSVDELRGAFDVVLRHVEAAAGDEGFTLEKDYFWAVAPDEAYDMAKAPNELTIGQASESWGHLRDVLADEDRALGHHLVWLADVLRAIGYERPV